ELLEENRLLDEPEAGAAFGFAHRDAEPAELRELGPAIVRRAVPIAVERVAFAEPGARLPLQLELLCRQREVHQRPFGRPSTRSRATSSSRFTPTSSDAVSAKPSVPRSCSSVVTATCQPWPSSPSRFDTGTSTSSKKISLNSASPVICRSGRTSTPGACMSTIRYVSPW